MGWYEYFLACIFALWAFSAPRDRNALRIVLIASLFSEVFVETVTRHIPGAWKLAIPGAVEVLTIAALVQFSPNKTGYLQSFCLLFAWLAHLLCYLDITLNTDIVYSRYETIIQLVAVAQIIVFHETIARYGRSVAAVFSASRVGRGSGVPSPSVCNSVLSGKATEVVQATRGVEERG